MVSVRKLSTINKVLLNVYEQERLYGLTLNTVAMLIEKCRKDLYEAYCKALSETSQVS